RKSAEEGGDIPYKDDAIDLLTFTSILLRLVTLWRVGAKSALLRHSFIPAEQKNVIRPLPCSSSPNRTRFAGLRFGFGCKLESWRIESVYAFHVGAKSALLRRSFF
ncbi:MAG: hypothetical protein ACI3UZ_02285, partial [Oscillospiraceae bacterium]